MCGNCKKTGTKCERSVTDRRSIRPTAVEIERLRRLVSSLLTTLASINDIVFNEPTESSLAKIKGVLVSSSNHEVQEKGTRKLPVSIGVTSGGNFSVYGPTSAFDNVMDMSTNENNAEFFDNSLMNLSSLILCLHNFFKWQYPDIAMFIHRESFLNDFMNPRSSLSYCSEELVYAIAAVGAKCSEDDSLRRLSQSFFETSKSKIFARKICHPQISTLQALLCLSLYELGDGNASASWMLSGMAIRMGYDLGFQLNPRDWTISSPVASDSQDSIITKMDLMVRSRIYWGCYVFDHFVSLVMGRPVTVRKSEASIPSSEHLPNSENIDDYIFRPSKVEGSVENLDVSVSLGQLCSLCDSVGLMLSDIFSSSSGEDGFAYLNGARLDKYNKSLVDWRSHLPSFMRWSKKSMRKQLYNPTVMTFRLFYYAILLCLNKPFLTMKVNAKGPSPHSVCNEAISELVICLSNFNESRYPSSTLVVYSSILGISVILAKVYSVDGAQIIPEDDLKGLKVFRATLSDACSSWKLASKALMFLTKRISELNIPPITQVFDTVEDVYQYKLTQQELDEIMDLGGHLASQENFFANFFEFLNDEDWGRA